MKILQVAPVYESIPPTKYGGAEEMIYYLINGLQKNDNYSVKLVASKDSKIETGIIPVFSKHYNYLLEKKSKEIPIFSYFGITFQDYIAYQLQGYDLVHNHFYGRNCYTKPLFAKMFNGHIPTIITVHNEVDIKQIGTLIFSKIKDANYVFLSDAQRKRHPELKSVGIVYNAVDLKDFPFSKDVADYYYWISMMVPAKGTMDAIQASRKSDISLFISGSISPDKPDYWKQIQTNLDDKIIYKGEADLKQKVKFYQKAKATIFPSRHREGCPMVPLESLACGTPVIAYDNPVVMEIIKDGYNGFICKNVNELSKAIRKIENMSKEEYLQMRKNCRQSILDKFTIEKMAEGYEKIYKKVIADWKKGKR